MFSDIDGELDISCFDPNNTLSDCSFDIDGFFDQTLPCNDAVGITEAFTDNLGRTQACTHAHACNPSGPNNPHTHTCVHVHTQVMPSTHEVPTVNADDTAESVDRKGQKRPAGNREAVRKYREKKKARASSLEEEVVRLRALNQQLMKRLQGQAVLEAEVARLKCLLVDVRGRIEGELGSFPYKKPTSFASSSAPGICAMNPCNIQCNDELHCLGSETALNRGHGLGDCGFDDLQCLGNHNSVPKDLSGIYKEPSVAQKLAR